MPLSIGLTVQEGRRQTESDAAALGFLYPRRLRRLTWTSRFGRKIRDAVMMFLRMQTQWTVSIAGYGLKYEVLLGSGGLFDLYNVEDPRRAGTSPNLEATALEELRNAPSKGTKHFPSSWNLRIRMHAVVIDKSSPPLKG